jgi:hypothetical protein
MSENYEARDRGNLTLVLTKRESLKPFGSYFRLNHSGCEDSRDHQNGKTDKADLFGRTHRITLPQSGPEPTSVARDHGHVAA